MKKKNKEEKKKTSTAVIIISIFLIVFLIVVLIILNNEYFNKKTYRIDYFSLEAKDYEETSEDDKTIVRKDGKCTISLSSKISSENVLENLGEIEKINDVAWVRQKFENGVSLFTNKDNIFYIIQMYGIDEDTYNSACLKDFEKIEKTFSFVKNE